MGWPFCTTFPLVVRRPDPGILPVRRIPTRSGLLREAPVAGGKGKLGQVWRWLRLGRRSRAFGTTVSRLSQRSAESLILLSGWLRTDSGAGRLLPMGAELLREPQG